MPHRSPWRRPAVAARFALLLAALAPASARLGAQGRPPGAEPERPAAAPADIASEVAIIQALYEVISGPKGQARDWNRFRSLFAEGARLIPAGRRPNGESGLRVLDVEGYIRAAEPYLVQHGFFEREIAARSERFGSVAHRFSTYESRHDAGDVVPFSRGINSIQLYHDGSRWWVVTILWDAERPDQPIPERYLPDR
ncbi:MAG TPA: hypothetical protein VNJ71_02945 [Gemmatimonadales bacterium]|nr:hypothetical protein [Gemmatimonadales bacterium]